VLPARPCPPEIGIGVRDALSGDAAGTVCEVFSRAVYLRMPEGMIALCSRHIPSGPLHLRCDLALHLLHRGDPVSVTAGSLRAADLVLLLDDASVWRGSLPDVRRVEHGRDVAALTLGEAALGSALLSPPFSHHLHEAVDHVTHGDLAGAAAVLGGLGPGLTPSGDDALAGLLIAARVRWGVGAEASLVGVAAAVDTHQISRCFLRWAARGQGIDPVHRFLAAVANRDRRLAEGALAALLAFGHTSGADLALGLQLGLGVLPAAPPGDYQLRGETMTTSTVSTARNVFDT
jgi:hypothetical protein